MRRGFVHLVAVLEWCARRILAWRLSNTLATDFCIDSDADFVDLVKAKHGIKLSMDSNGA